MCAGVRAGVAMYNCIHKRDTQPILTPYAWCWFAFAAAWLGVAKLVAHVQFNSSSIYWMFFAISARSVLVVGVVCRPCPVRLHLIVSWVKNWLYVVAFVVFRRSNF